MSKKVLVIEDMEYLHNIWHRELDSKVVLLSALSIEEAEEKFTANPDIDAIVMDACVPGVSPTTPPLVQKFRESFTGPIIAISSLREYRRQLVQAGCDYESTKDNMPAKLLEVLGLDL